MQATIFDNNLAVQYGVNEAIFLNNMQRIIFHNKHINDDFFDERHWYRISTNKLEGIYPFWSTDQIDHVIKSLVDQGVILVGNYCAFVNEELFGDGHG